MSVKDKANCRRSDNAANSQDCHLFPTVSKVGLQNTSPWRDSGGVVQLAFMCELERIRRDTSTKIKEPWRRGSFARDGCRFRIKMSSNVRKPHRVLATSAAAQDPQSDHASLLLLRQ